MVDKKKYWFVCGQSFEPSPLAGQSLVKNVNMLVEKHPLIWQTEQPHRILIQFYVEVPEDVALKYIEKCKSNVISIAKPK